VRCYYEQGKIGREKSKAFKRAQEKQALAAFCDCKEQKESYGCQKKALAFAEA